MKCIKICSVWTFAGMAMWLALGSKVEAGPGCWADCAPCVSCAPTCVQYQTYERTIMVPRVSWESRQIAVTVCRPEVRRQTITVMKPVYEVKSLTQHYTVMEVQQRSHVENYEVCTPVWRNVERQVTEMVPEREVRQGVRHVCQPYQEQEMRVVCRDQGRWEERQMAYDSGCDYCGGCRSKCGCGAPAYTVCRVWVPNIVQEQVPVMVWKTRLVEQPFEYEVTVCKPQNRVVVDRVCEMQREQKSRTINYNVCVPKPMTKQVDVRVCRYVPEPQEREFTVMVPHQEMREVRVPVCTMVPKVITCRVPVYAPCAPCGCGG
jgi:hypothetical protein